jgi:hypothetical protein
MTTTTSVPCFFAMAVEGRMPSEAAMVIGPHAQTRGQETDEACRTPFLDAELLFAGGAVGAVVVGECVTPQCVI